MRRNLEPWGVRRAALDWREVWWPGVRPLVAGVGVCVALLMVFSVMAEEVVEDRRDRFDFWFSLAVHHEASPVLTRVMRVWTELGSTAAQLVLGGLMAGWLLGRHRPRAAAVTVVAWVTGHFAVQVVKSLLHRARPDLFPPLVHPGGYSFPSGHTFVATVLYGLLAAFVASRLRGRVRVVPWVVWGVNVAGVGFSRVYLGAHYGTDVIGSVLLGGVWLLGTLIVIRVIEEPRRFFPLRAERVVEAGVGDRVVRGEARVSSYRGLIGWEWLRRVGVGVNRLSRPRVETLG